jgi:hypothetical protein
MSQSTNDSVCKTWSVFGKNRDFVFLQLLQDGIWVMHQPTRCTENVVSLVLNQPEPEETSPSTTTPVWLDH